MAVIGAGVCQRLGIACTLLGWWTSAAVAVDFGDRLGTACPAAVQEMEQLQRRHSAPAVTPVITRPALRQELLQIVEEDQAARERWIAASAGQALADDDPATQELQHVDARLLPRLRHIVAQDGFPSPAMVGNDGVAAAFLLTQHADADPAFQARVLKLTAGRLRGGGIDGQQYAMLTDRVLVNQHKAQRYGTQFEGVGSAMQPRPIADAAHVDARRHALGLTSMSNYTCILRVMYGSP